MHRVITRALLSFAFALCLVPIAAAQEVPAAKPAPSPADRLVEALSDAKTPQERATLLDGAGGLLNADLWKALIARGRSLQRSGNPDRALDAFLTAQVVAEKIGDRAGVGSALGYIGTYYALKGMIGPATEDFRRAIAEHRAAGNRLGEFLQLNNLGIAQASQGDTAGALESFEECLKLTEELGKREDANVMLYNIGNVYKGKGDYVRALDYYSRSLSVGKEFGGDIFGALVNIGELYLEQGNYAQAVAYLQDALKLVKGYYGRAVVLTNLADASRAQGNLTQALEYYRQAMEANEKAGRSPVASLRGIGETYFAQGDYARALGYYEKAKAVAGPNELPATLTLIAEAHLAKRDYQEALESADQATAVADRTASATQLWRAHTAAGRALRALGRPDESRRRFEQAVESVEALRSRVVGGEQAHAQFFENKVSPYQEIVELFVSQGDDRGAFAFAERSKARALLDVLRSGRVNVTKAMTNREQEQERQFQNELASLNAQLSAEGQRKNPDRQLLDGLRAKVEKTRLDYESFKTSLYATHPALQVQRGEARPVGPEEAAELLPDASSALLEYVVTAEKTYLFVLTKGDGRNGPPTVLKAYSISAGRKEIETLVEGYRRMLAEGGLDFHAPGRELYDLLLKPAEAQLRGKDVLVLVPDGALWDLPFQALQPSALRYMVEERAVFYAPSLTVLREMRKARRGAGGAGRNTAQTLLAFGDPDVGAETRARLKAVYMDEKLEPLPEAGKQVAALARLYGAENSRVYTGTAAREETAKAEAPNYRVLQFATHGVLDSNSPMYSHLVLSRPATGGSEDGLLEAWEVADMSLNADLAVLAACETARGRFGAGEGIVGMSWAFFIAGVPTTVVSQWKVESASTTRLMLEFHRELLAGRQSPQSRFAKARALQQAALKLLKSREYNHPSYWAGFVLVGDGY